jgi:lauroyl/myristoyl acyltransferase
MAGSPRLFQLFYRLYFGFWIPTLVWASTWWPLGLMYWMCRWLVILPFNVVRPKYLRAIKGNCARILDLPVTHPEVRRVAWRMTFEHAYHWVDFFRWSQLPVERLLANVAAVHGEEHFRTARTSGRGTLLLTAHMGNPEVGAGGLGRQLETVHILYWRDRFATAEEFRTKMRLRANVHGIPVDASPYSVIPALRVLEEGGIVAAHGDRDFNDQGWRVPFFGADAAFPPGPFLLAAKAHALIVPTFFLARADRRFEVVYEAPIDVKANGTLEQRAREAMQGFIGILERQVRANPHQWYTFYPFWEARGASLREPAAAEQAPRHGSPPASA